MPVAGGTWSETAGRRKLRFAAFQPPGEALPGAVILPPECEMAWL